MKLALPILLAGIVMIAGIFALMPVDQASTVHTTIQGTQLNNVNSTFDTDLATNATATCSSGSFLVYYTFTNGTVQQPAANAINVNATLGIDDSTTGGIDLKVVLHPGNQTAVSGVIGGTSSETLTFSGLGPLGGLGEDSGDLSLTVVCQSTATATLVPTP